MSDSMEEETYLYGVDYVNSVKNEFILRATNDAAISEEQKICVTPAQAGVEKVSDVVAEEKKTQFAIDTEPSNMDEHFESIAGLSVEDSNSVSDKEQNEICVVGDQNCTKSNKKMAQFLIREPKSIPSTANPETGRITIENLKSVGFINGVPAHEFEIDTLKEKLWQKEGADISNFFNYGFVESTWRDFCERQKKNTQGQPLPPGTDAQPIHLLSTRKRINPRPIDVVTTLGPKAMCNLSPNNYIDRKKNSIRNFHNFDRNKQFKRRFYLGNASSNYKNKYSDGCSSTESVEGSGQSDSQSSSEVAFSAQRYGQFSSSISTKNSYTADGYGQNEYNDAFANDAQYEFPYTMHNVSNIDAYGQPYSIVNAFPVDINGSPFFNQNFYDVNTNSQPKFCAPLINTYHIDGNRQYAYPFYYGNGEYESSFCGQYAYGETRSSNSVVNAYNFNSNEQYGHSFATQNLYNMYTNCKPFNTLANDFQTDRYQHFGRRRYFPVNSFNVERSALPESFCSVNFSTNSQYQCPKPVIEITVNLDGIEQYRRSNFMDNDEEHVFEDNIIRNNYVANGNNNNGFCY